MRPEILFRLLLRVRIPPSLPTVSGVHSAMKKFLVCALVVGISSSFSSRPAFATKPYGEAWTAFYVTDSKNAEFKKLAEEAKCNACHVDKEDKKKVRNPYGVEAQKLINKTTFPVAKFKSEPDKVKAEIEAAFKKLEEVKAKDGQTFGEKIKAGKLPGGDVSGK